MIDPLPIAFRNTRDRTTPYLSGWQILAAAVMSVFFSIGGICAIADGRVVNGIGCIVTFGMMLPLLTVDCSVRFPSQ